MSRQLIVGLIAFSVALVGTTLYLTGLNDSGISVAEVLSKGILLIVVAVGLLIVSKRVRNPIGWILIDVAIGNWLYSFMTAYARFALFTQPGSLPLGIYFAWMASWIWILYAGPVVIYLPLLFPTGRLLSPRWRGVAWLAGCYLAGFVLVNAVRPGPLAGFESIRNPFGLESLEKSSDYIIAVTNMLVLPLAFVSVYALLLRFVHSRGEERAQIKWFFYVSALFVPYLIYGIGSDTGLLAALPGWANLLLFPSYLGLFALAIGIAILKYRLYDIDLIIRRTLQYSLLTGLLALSYFSGVVLLQGIFNLMTGTPGSSLVTVITTLGIAALFNPLRHRVQGFIDRRFYRKKYDAERALAQFAVTARDEVESGRLTSSLLGIVRETMQPEQATLWLAQGQPAGATSRQSEE
jgi:hypothetical protein